MAAHSTAPPGSPDGSGFNDAKDIGSDEHAGNRLTQIVTFNPQHEAGKDLNAHWARRYPDPVERGAAVRAILENALRTPASPGELCLQLVSGSGDGMRLIRRLAAQEPSARYAAFPISNPEAIALVGTGRYFEPLIAADDSFLCRCLPLGRPMAKYIGPLNGLVRRLRKHGGQP